MGGINEKDLKLFRREDFEKLPYYILDYIDNKKQIFYFKQFQDKTGFCTLTKIRSKEKSANYVTKYITKKPIRNLKGTLYICSRGLKRSYSYDIKAFNFDKACEVLGTTRTSRSGKVFHNYYTTDYVKSIDINLKELNTSQAQWIEENISEYTPILDAIRNKIKKHKKDIDF